MKKPVLVPTDLTDVGTKAVHQAGIIARKAGTSVTLLHVLNEKSPSWEDARKKLDEEAERVKELTGKECEVLLGEGSIFEEIPRITLDHSFDLVVIGTHGKHGIKQHLMGAYILKLINRILMPVLVVQEDTPPLEKIRTLLMPVSSHPDFHKEIESVLMLCSLFGSEVHLYSIHKPGFDWTPQMLKNIEDATRIFEANGVTVKRVREEQQVYSPGYAKQSLLYAALVKADMVAMMTAPSDDYYYFAAADKEAMLLNDLHLPVLCTG
ncbi:MAG: universal stress protein [Bacteroidetes bacterium]|nr:universal stress protein [Bacteroidota bacterium]